VDEMMGEKVLGGGGGVEDWVRDLGGGFSVKNKREV